MAEGLKIARDITHPKPFLKLMGHGHKIVEIPHDVSIGVVRGLSA